MPWTTPVTTWVSGNGIAYGDLNRIENNIERIRDATYRCVHGFGYVVNNSIAGEDGIILVLPGSCYSENGIPMKSSSTITKNLDAWAQGSGTNIGGVASSVTVAAHTWYYAFLIMNPNDDSVDLMIDENPNGSNISSGIFTEKRYINCFKTGAAGGDGSFDVVEMYSTGDRVFINPNSMYADRDIAYANSAPIDNVYQTITLSSGGAEGYALPARVVKANLNVRLVDIQYVGLISLYSSVFTVPTNLMSGGDPSAEYFLEVPASASYPGTDDLEIMINASRQIAMGMNGSVPGEVKIAIRGFYDERLQ